jgi:hypothetical protein
VTKNKLDPLRRLEAYRRVVSCGDTKKSVATDLGVSERTIRRIVDRGLDELMIDAGLVKPRVRVKAGSASMVEERVLTLLEEGEKVASEKEGYSPEVRSGIVTYNPTNPIGEPVEPVGLVRKLGTREQITQHGTTIVTDSSGRAVRVERCPVHRRLGASYSFETVEITGIDGIKVRGEYRQWSGESVSGTLIFDGQGCNGSRRITSVVFIPDDAVEAKAQAEILRDKPKVA